MYKSAGKSDKAAKGYESCAKAYEDELEYELAVENYREAARLYSMEKYKDSYVNKCSIKVAELQSRDCGTAEMSQVIDAIKVTKLFIKKV
jgi:Soluble NSF attachment protein, SNAP